MLKRLYGYFGKYKKFLLISALCVVAESTFEMLIPLIMAQIIDVGVVAKAGKAYILWKSGEMVLCALLALGLGMLYARCAALAGQGFGAQLRKAEYRKLQDFSFANMDHFSTPSLITRLTGDITVLQNAVTNGLRPAVRGPVMMVIAVVMTLALSPRLAAVFAVSMPVLALLLLLILRRLSPIYGRMQRMLDQLNSVVQENLTAIRTVKSFVRGEDECEKFGAVNEDFRRTSQGAFHFAQLNLPCFQFVMYGTIIAILWFGGMFIREGTLQVGQLTGFLSYVMQILNSLMMISNVFLMLSRSTTSGRRILEVMDEKPEIEGSGSGAKVRRGDVEFEHVYFKYKKTAKEFVLTDISLCVGAGQTIGVIGSTGSAKSTFVQLIPRLYDASAGSIRIDGRDVRDYDVAHLRDAIGMVLQKNTLFSGTIRENLRWGDECADDGELDWACRIACADEFIKRLPKGYDTDLGQGGVNVSGGQKQRLCIARALLKRPRILILDDSLSAVDMATEARIRERLAQELRDTTKIIITQRVNAIERADLIVVLREGSIEATGTHAELLRSNAMYRDLWEFQQKGAIA